MSKPLSRLEIEQENYVKYKWLKNKLKNAKRLDGVDCIDCRNHIRVKEQFHDEQMFGPSFWIETDSYCKLGMIPESPKCYTGKRCKGHDYGKPRVKYVRLRKT